MHAARSSRVQPDGCEHENARAVLSADADHGAARLDLAAARAGVGAYRRRSVPAHACPLAAASVAWRAVGGHAGRVRLWVEATAAGGSVFAVLHRAVADHRTGGADPAR